VSSSVAECLCSMCEALGCIPRDTEKQKKIREWWYTAIILALRKLRQGSLNPRPAGVNLWVPSQQICLEERKEVSRWLCQNTEAEGRVSCKQTAISRCPARAHELPGALGLAAWEALKAFSAVSSRPRLTQVTGWCGTRTTPCLHHRGHKVSQVLGGHADQCTHPRLLEAGTHGSLVTVQT
jgi:hypothetical protein